MADRVHLLATQQAERASLQPYMLLEGLAVASVIVNYIPSRAEGLDPEKHPHMVHLGELVNGTKAIGNVVGYRAVEDAFENIKSYIEGLSPDVMEELAQEFYPAAPIGVPQ